MRLLDTRKYKIDEWLNERIAKNGYRSLNIVTGFLYQRGWQAIKAPANQILKIKTVSSVHVDQGTADSLKKQGSLLSAPNIEFDVKIYTQCTQHAKLFILSDASDGSDDIVVIGSSNLTGPGLGISEQKNLELNYIVNEPESIKSFTDWFQSLWLESKSHHEVNFVVEKIHEQSPKQTVFAQLIPGILTFADVIKNWIADQNDVGKDYQLAANESYQRDAVEQIDFRLQYYGCAFLSDDVGLGKTIMGAASIKRMFNRAIPDFVSGQNFGVLVICPQQVQTQWSKHLVAVVNQATEEYAIDSSKLICALQLATYGQEQSKVWKENKHGFDEAHIGLIVIDEAHRLRNGTTFYRWLADLVNQIQSKGAKPKFLFLTATPINNSFMDLYNIFKISLPASFWQAEGIQDIHQSLNHLDKNFDAIDDRFIKDDLNKVRAALGKIMIRRDVHYLKENYITNLNIPNVKENKNVVEVNSGELDKSVDKLIHYMKHCMFHAYRLSATYDEMHTTRKVELEKSVGGILRGHLSKSIQSSVVAGMRSLLNIIDRCGDIMRTGEREAIATIERDFGQDISDDDPEVGNREELTKIDNSTLDNIRADVEKDIVIMKEFYNFLTGIQKQCDQEKANGLRLLLDKDYPTLVFTEYHETARWLAKYLTSRGLKAFVCDGTNEDELLRLDPSDDSDFKNEVPNFEVYILTDKYSEGKNFHKCRAIVNYDLPWNPIRKIQRQGRIVRLNSEHKEVEIHSISYTHPKLNKFADPQRVLREKLEKIASLFGKGHNADICGEGQRFVSMMQRLRSSIGLDTQSKIDSLGLMAEENDSTYLTLVWNEILKGQYHSQVKELLKQWYSLLNSKDQTMVLDEKNTELYAILQDKSAIAKLLWFQIADYEAKLVKISDFHGMLISSYCLKELISEDRHLSEVTTLINPKTNKEIDAIVKIVKTINKANLLRQLNAILKNLASHKQFEFFVSLQRGFKKVKESRNGIEKLLLKVIADNSEAVKPVSERVVVCSEGYVKSLNKLKNVS